MYNFIVRHREEIRYTDSNSDNRTYIPEYIHLMCDPYICISDSQDGTRTAFLKYIFRVVRKS